MKSKKSVKGKVADSTAKRKTVLPVSAPPAQKQAPVKQMAKQESAPPVLMESAPVANRAHLKKEMRKEVSPVPVPSVKSVPQPGSSASEPTPQAPQTVLDSSLPDTLPDALPKPVLASPRRKKRQAAPRAAHPERAVRPDVRGRVEALLFSSGRALSEDALASLLDTDPADVRRALKALKEDYDGRETSLKIYEENKTWRMMIKDAFVDVARKVVADTELGKATLETLAVIAYRHPKALQAEVVQTRGSNAYEHIKELEDAGFIVRAKEGRTFAIKLTEKFFEYFDVAGEKDIREAFSNMQPKEHQKKLGDLDVVDVLPETKAQEEAEAKKELLEGMEVVDVHESEEGENHDDNPFMARQLGNMPVMTPEERNAQASFLDDLDAKIAKIADRNTAHDQDETFKRFVREDVQDYLKERSPNDAGGARGDVSGEDAATNDADDQRDAPKKSALDEPLDLEDL